MKNEKIYSEKYPCDVDRFFCYVMSRDTELNFRNTRTEFTFLVVFDSFRMDESISDSRKAFFSSERERNLFFRKWSHFSQDDFQLQMKYQIKEGP